MPRLENWSVYGVNRVVGYVFDHPRYDDGTRIVTTSVRKWNMRIGLIETQTSIFLLGDKRI